MIIVSLVVLVITVVNLLGVRESAVMTNIFTIGKLLPLLIFVFVGAFFIQPSNFTFGEMPQYGAFSSAVLLLIYAFVGFEASVVLSGETKEPQRTMPFGLIAGLGVVATLYIFVQVVSIGSLPGLAASERPIADAAAVFLGPFGAAFITLGALISIFGNLNVGVLSSTRLLFAMSEQRDLPTVFERTHSKLKTPYVSILATSAVILILTIQSSFLTAVAIATITRLLVYATTLIALPLFRGRDEMPSPPFHAPMGIVSALLSLGLIGWLLTNVDFRKEGLAVIITVGVGVVIYFANKAWRHFAATSDTTGQYPQ